MDWPSMKSPFLNVSFNKFLTDLICEDDFEARRLKAEVEETRPGEKGKDGVFGWFGIGHGEDDGIVNGKRTGRLRFSLQQAFRVRRTRGVCLEAISCREAEVGIQRRERVR